MPMIRPEDIPVLVYLAVLPLTLVFFHQGVSGWPWYAALYLAVGGVVLLWLRFADGHGNPAVRFFRHWYLPFLFTFFYEGTKPLLLAVRGRWLDQEIIAFEQSLLGFHPTVALDRMVTPWLTELLNLSYHSYYWLIPLLGFSLYLRGDIVPFRRLIFTVAAAFFASYYGFILFPVEGPRYALDGMHQAALTGFIFTPLQDFIMAHGDLQGGGCMPSSHVAVAFSVLLLSWTYRKGLAVVLTPLVVLLCVATIYLRYHYLSDVAAGLALGAAAFLAGGRVFAEAKNPVPSRAMEAVGLARES